MTWALRIYRTTPSQNTRDRQYFMIRHKDKGVWWWSLRGARGFRAIPHATGCRRLTIERHVRTRPQEEAYSTASARVRDVNYPCAPATTTFGLGFEMRAVQSGLIEIGKSGVFDQGTITSTRNHRGERLREVFGWLDLCAKRASDVYFGSSRPHDVLTSGRLLRL